MSDMDAGDDQDTKANDNDAMDEDGDCTSIVDNASQDIAEKKGPDEDDEDVKDAEDAYQKTKAMGDLDQKVIVFVLLSAHIYSPPFSRDLKNRIGLKMTALPMCAPYSPVRNNLSIQTMVRWRMGIGVNCAS
jgi:hypothetical protein